MIDINSNVFEIRELDPDDYLAAASVYLKSPYFMITLNGYLPESLNIAIVEQEAAEARRHGAVYCGVVLRQTNEMIGIATFELYGHEGQLAVAWIALVLIAEPYQHHGFGTQVYGLIEQAIFNDSRVLRIEIGVLLNNKQALSFWSGMGYQPSGSIQRDEAGQLIQRMQKPRPSLRANSGINAAL